MSSLPKISVITPSFNQADYLEQAILSVSRQRNAHVEHIIIDGGSTDHSLEVIKKYRQHIADWISEPDRGVFDAMNKGIQQSSGEWLYFLGCDDVFHDEGVLEEIFSTDLSKLEVIYGDVLLKHKQTLRGGAFTAARFYERLDNIVHQAIFCRRSVFDKIGFFDPKMIVSADFAHNLAWFGHPEIRHTYVKRTIAIYNETGLSSRTQDVAFHTKRSILFYQYLGKLLKKEKPGLYLQLLPSAGRAYMLSGKRTKAFYVYLEAFRLTGKVKSLKDAIYWFIISKRNTFVQGSKLLLILYCTSQVESAATELLCQ